jgi:hypothetical protein
MTHLFISKSKLLMMYQNIKDKKVQNEIQLKSYVKK